MKQCRGYSPVRISFAGIITASVYVGVKIELCEFGNKEAAMNCEDPSVPYMFWGLALVTLILCAAIWYDWFKTDSFTHEED
jgi:hypothetical protein